jgi:hypothetical protein
MILTTSEKWKPIPKFPGYSVSNHGRIMAEKTGRLLALSDNQYGVQCVGLMLDGEQRHRSVPKLVATAFLPQFTDVFDTPINLDGDRHNNHVSNLVWRPRWFAVKYNRQFREPYPHSITEPIMDMKTREISPNSFEAAKRYGLLEQDLVMSILERTVVWPTYQEFRIVED